MTASRSVVKRDGSIVPFERVKIYYAIERAFRDEKKIPNQHPLPEETKEQIILVTDAVIALLGGKSMIKIEEIQDRVEDRLMDFDHAVARSYILYRDMRRRSRFLREGDAKDPIFRIKHRDGSLHPFKSKDFSEKIQGKEDLLEEVMAQLYDGASIDEVNRAFLLVARSRIEWDPSYSKVAAHLLLQDLSEEVLGNFFPSEEEYKKGFCHYISKADLNPALKEYNLEKLAKNLKLNRDLTFNYLGLQILYDRYFIHKDGKRLEMPQYFWMRVAMGLALNEGQNKEEWAIRFYDLLSEYRFVSSTPTLFNAGTHHPQLSSCYLTTVKDDLDHIFKVVSDNAKLSKWAGGIGNDWTPIRSTGARIKGTNGLTTGIIPFLKIINDTAVAVNQGGKRKGAICCYLETWHLDIEEFLELRKNTGDERRRTHDMNTANWIPDLFMKRVQEDGEWTLFNPVEVSDLHDIWGKAFEKRYCEYEALAKLGKVEHFKTISAKELWQKMLTMLFETGHPWITFKDPSNARSAQQHIGVVHSSNLCTEILLNTSAEETAVCNLGSVNLSQHINDTNELDREKLKETVTIAIRMLDNVIDLNFYPTPEARQSNMRHRPIGMGMMGFHDALFQMRIPYDSEDAVALADKSTELVSYFAILASSQLAHERGFYSTYSGSLWDQGILPIDSIDRLEEERGTPIDCDRSSRLNWDLVRESLSKHGMRNCQVMAIAPTATISYITGTTPSIDPIYSNLYSRSNLSGDFILTNPYLVHDLKKLGLWDQEMLEELKYWDGSIQEIERIPADLKKLYRTAFEIDQGKLIECASRRQKWIDMGQSLNLYFKDTDGKKFSNMYFYAWRKGLKTTYYLRSLAPTQAEKSTIDVNRWGVQPRWMKNRSASSEIEINRQKVTVCSLLDPECEGCQ